MTFPKFSVPLSPWAPAGTRYAIRILVENFRIFVGFILIDSVPPLADLSDVTLESTRLFRLKPEEASTLAVYFRRSS